MTEQKNQTPEAPKQPTTQPAKPDNSKTYAFIATFLGFVGFVIAILAWKEDKYVMFYAKQSLVISILYALAMISGRFLDFLPFIGWAMSGILWLAVAIIWMMSWINALSGQQKDMPVISDIAKKINL